MKKAWSKVFHSQMPGDRAGRGREMRTMPPRGTTSMCRAEALRGDDGIISVRDVVKSEAQAPMFQEQRRRVQMHLFCLHGVVQEQGQDVRMMFLWRPGNAGVKAEFQWACPEMQPVCRALCGQELHSWVQNRSDCGFSQILSPLLQCPTYDSDIRVTEIVKNHSASILGLKPIL